MTQTATQQAIHQLFAGHTLSADQADAAMSEIMQGEATPAQVGAFLAALRMKGETVDEITGCARAMKRSAVQVRPQIGDAMLVDVVGTGGDSLGTFNISTTTAFVVAGHGVKVAKHGNRAVSSKCGSADVLAALGVNLQLTAEQAATCIEDVGMAFLFAPSFHPAMRHAIGPRRELAARTIFNILGPLTNPAGATNLLVGVFDPNLTEVMANVLGQMGARAAYVVYGAGGTDELSIAGANRVSHYHAGNVRTYDFDPAELGIPRATVQDLIGRHGRRKRRHHPWHPLRRDPRPQARCSAAQCGFCSQHRVRRPAGRTGRGTAEHRQRGSAAGTGQLYPHDAILRPSIDCRHNI